MTLVLLLLPGDVVEGLVSWLRQWWRGPSLDGLQGLRFWDKLVHAGLFVICGVLLARAWLNESVSWLRLFLLLVAFGLLTETLQYFIPGRNANASDLFADAVGAAIGIACVIVLDRRR